MEVVLDGVELETTNPFQDFDKIVVLLCFIILHRNQKMVRSGDCHDVLAAPVFEAGSSRYFGESNAYKDRYFLLLLGNDAGTAIFQSKDTTTFAQKTIFPNS